MSLTSISFLLGCIALVILYYIIPKRFQWGLLLIASLLFYSMAGLKNVIFILITSLSTYAATRAIDGLTARQKAWIKENKKTATKEEKNAYKADMKRKKKLLLISTLVLNFGIMCTFKYVHFVLEQVNAIIRLWNGVQIQDTLQWIIPLGISFYTFQTMGYLVDVYWEKVPAEKNYAKVLLFVSFFPQMTQGPISDFETLTSELFKEHSYTYHQFSWGAQRMIWGYFKKMVVANIMSVYVNDVFANYGSYSGISTLIGAFMYSIQIYADFSGYMDIVCGLCEILGIRLTENFEQPYFSRSIAEYWRRWHSSLGAWFKTYIYYPIALAKWNQNLGRKAKKAMGTHVGETIPASIALVGVWLTTGLWHGASWAYIAWGGVNGLFIIFSLWMEPVYASWKQKLHIKEESRGWICFTIIRTFILVTFIKVLPEVGTLSQGWGLWMRIFTNHTLDLSLHGLLPFVHDGTQLLTAFCGTCLIFLADVIQTGQPVRQWMEEKLPYVVRILFYAGLVVLIALFDWKLSDVAGGFMYAQF